MKMYVANSKLAFEVDDNEHDRVKGILGSRPTERGFTLPFTYATIEMLQGVEFEFGDEYTEKYYKNLVHFSEQVLDMTMYDLQHPRLSPLQNQGADWLRRGSRLLADQMGVGKTVQVCVALEASNNALIITTKSTLGMWYDHLLTWGGCRPEEIFVLHGSTAHRKKVMAAADAYGGRKVIITTHGMLLKHSDYDHYGKEPAGKGPDNWLNKQDHAVVVVDEVHKFRSPKGKTYRALTKVADAATKVWCLTGTPIEDNPDDIWMVLRLLHSGHFQYRSRFRDRYCSLNFPRFGGVVNEGIRPEMQDEWDRVLRHYMLRRMRKQVWPELPDAVPTEYRTIEMLAGQKKAYRQMKKEQIVEIDGEMLLALDPITVYQKLDYISSGVPIIKDGEVIGLEHKGSNKLEAILDIAEERDGDPFVVYAPSSKVVDMLERGLQGAGYNVGKITGAVDGKTRSALVEMFQANKIDIMVMTSAGAEGLTLTAADLLVYCDLDWSARTNQQVADRIDRMGQDRPPQRIVLMSEGTIDVSRRFIVDGKEEGQQAILKDVDRLQEIADGTYTE